MSPARRSPPRPAFFFLFLASALGVLLTRLDADARLPLRVLLIQGAPSAEVGAPAALRIYSLAEERLVRNVERGGSIQLRADGDRILLAPRGGLTLSSGDALPPGGVRFRAVGGAVRLNGTPYRGAIDVAASGGRLWAVNSVRLEDYLRGVVGREVSPAWPPAALQAQAVAARTFALLIRAQAERASQGRALYHLTAGTGDQVYGGIGAEHPAVDAAVKSTEGEVLVYRGALARAFFHAASGGYTEAARAVWPVIDGPYLRGVPVPQERSDPTQEWEVRIGREELRAALAREGHLLGPIEEVRVEGRTPSGRAARVRIVHRSGEIALAAPQLRRALGHTRIRSALFALEPRRDAWVFRGRGYGHGVGMSQQGARLLAEAGMRYTRILTFFYPGASLGRAEEAAFPDEALLVPQEIDDLSRLLR